MDIDISKTQKQPLTLSPDFDLNWADIPTCVGVLENGIFPVVDLLCQSVCTYVNLRSFRMIRDA